jgi:predicted ester cyclase
MEPTHTAPAPAVAPAVGTAAIRRTVLRFVHEVVNAGDLAALDEVLAPDVVVELPGAPEPQVGVDAYRDAVVALRTAFPDIHADPLDLAVDRLPGGGHLAMVALRTRGTNTGTLFGLPATGRRAVWTTVHTWHLRNGRVVFDRALPDLLSMYTQLGVLTPPGAA